MDFHTTREKYMQTVNFNIHSKNHIDTFNYFLDKGLGLIAASLPKIEIDGEAAKTNLFKDLKFWFDNITVGSPSIKPFEARLTHTTYTMPLFVTLNISVDGEEYRKSFSMGDMPVMLLSRHCVLYNKPNLADYKEDDKEPGGYFIVNGLEKILRNIIIPRKNCPLALYRPTFHARKKQLSGYAVMVKSTIPTYRSQTLYVHYGTDNNIYMTLMIRKTEYVFPAMLIIKAISDLSDMEIISLLKVEHGNFNPIVMIEDLHSRGLDSKEKCLNHLGASMRHVMGFSSQRNKPDPEIGQLFIEQYVLMHLGNSGSDKLNLISFMVKKVVDLFYGKIEVDNLDALTTQELLTSGQIFGLFFREKMEEALYIVKAKLIKDLAKKADLPLLDTIEKSFANATQVGKKIEHLLATGNLKSNSGLDLMQNNGYSIIAERLNNSRFWSHLRSIHRGAYFVEMKTTTVRKLLPENWGFLCPVHTPDGGLCGLLNHLSTGCVVQPEPVQLTDKDIRALIKVLKQIGLKNTGEVALKDDRILPVLIDGRVLGCISEKSSDKFADQVRKILKSPTSKYSSKYTTLSIAIMKHNPQVNKLPAYPCIYMSLSEGRPLRKVYNIAHSFVETIDPFEQSYMMISTNLEELTETHTHIELSVDSLLSELAGQIPYMVHNQSPRNMYQCQMAKQTMGTSTHALSMRADNKMYCINFPQKPITSSPTYEALGYEDFPSGINAVVAVLSYTGYDIEDAMIINKSAYERGFMHGNVTKTYVIDMNDERTNKPSMLPLNKTDDFKEKYAQCEEPDTNRYDINDLLAVKKPKKKTDVDGLPIISEKMRHEDTKMQFHDVTESKLKNKYYKDVEESTVDTVTLCSMKDKENHNLVNLKFRYNRNPVVGDKFSSRHGQKGVLSILWPQTDMPFTESGITPDIIINPNAFPSRMTIGMLIESMAGKNACLKGQMNKTGAFQPCDWRNIGVQLQEQGYSYVGTEIMYSGVYGIPFKTEIYQGIVYYQRLRHMIKDKAQARATGPIDALTHQPIKGRKKGGGIRFGEMERDALIAHGVSFIMKDRLMNCSDTSEGFICKECGNLLSCFEREDTLVHQKERVCVLCEQNGSTGAVKKIRLPYVLRYLTNELAAMNIKVQYKLK